MCLDQSLEQVFVEVVDEVLKRIKDGDGCVVACTSTLKDFSDLLSAASQPPIDSRKVRGLVGELVYLDRLVQLDAAAWELWRGPLKGGERHDFRGKSESVEIKATSRVANTKVRISSIDQLAVPAGGSLHLIKLVLESTVSGALTVEALTTRILSRCANPDEVAARLAAMGCGNHTSPEWNAFAYELEGEEAYQVRGGFPRIVPESVPSGLSGIEYDVDLAAAQAFLLAQEGADQITTRLIACL
jgi:hypothetical protein